MRDAKVTYQVEFKNSLNAATWTALGDFNATSASTSATNTGCGTPQERADGIFVHMHK